MSHKSEQTKQGSKTYSTDRENKGSKVFNKYLGSNVCVEGGRGGGGKGGGGEGEDFMSNKLLNLACCGNMIR